MIIAAVALAVGIVYGVIGYFREHPPASPQDSRELREDPPPEKNEQQATDQTQDNQESKQNDQ